MHEIAVDRQRLVEQPRLVLTCRPGRDDIEMFADQAEPVQGGMPAVDGERFGDPGPGVEDRFAHVLPVPAQRADGQLDQQVHRPLPADRRHHAFDGGGVAGEELGVPQPHVVHPVHVTVGERLGSHFELAGGHLDEDGFPSPTDQVSSIGTCSVMSRKASTTATKPSGSASTKA